MLLHTNKHMVDCYTHLVGKSLVVLEQIQNTNPFWKMFVSYHSYFYWFPKVLRTLEEKQMGKGAHHYISHFGIKYEAGFGEWVEQIAWELQKTVLAGAQQHLSAAVAVSFYPFNYLACFYEFALSQKLQGFTLKP